MYEKLSKEMLVPLILRLALAAIFIYNGLAKISPESEWGANWSMKMVKRDLPAQIQLAVAWGELAGGIAFFFGFLTRLAALGILPIMAGAIHHVSKSTSELGHYQIQFLVVMICLALIVGGGGTLSLDHLLWRKKKAPEGNPGLAPVSSN